MRKSSASLRNSGTFTSPGTPEYGDNSAGEMLKGWSSERVPLPSNSSRRHINGAALMPFYSGRALPSKWDDAERWITSPLSGNSVGKNSVVQHQRRPKSKSGPLVSPGLMYLSNYSPLVPALEGGGVRNFMAGSPFTTGVLLPDGVSLQYATGIGEKSNALYAENCIDQPTKVHQLTDLLSEPSTPNSQDGKPNGPIQAGTVVSRVASRRDMATQMSPDESTNSSPERQSSGPTYPPPSPPATMEQHNSAKVEVKDVQVDKGTAVPKKSKKHRTRKTKRGLKDDEHFDPPWDRAGEARNNSRIQREEAKIAAWENLQKAKAEAAIQKLEMKLEKKRSDSMDKILNKLRAAQMKAQEMRMSTAECHANQRTSKKTGFFNKYIKMNSFTAHCFCQAS